VVDKADKLLFSSNRLVNASLHFDIYVTIVISHDILHPHEIHHCKKNFDHFIFTCVGTREKDVTHKLHDMIRL